MAVLTDVASSELVVPVEPSTVHRTVDRRADNRWAVNTLDTEFATALGALLAIRGEVELSSRHPVEVQIRWRGVPAGFVPPTSGRSL